MASDSSTENFQGWASFFLVGDFSKKTFQNVQHKILHPNIFGAWQPMNEQG